ncbi:MAG: hypothetical protein K6T87_16135 [Roseiflexus sp.]|uniref:hypothetical protein n=1 Tax=Roseiflexus sp. TaxID=2562120 RepID=UPI0025F94AE9|nr:hypothetical protein [Roseiflexus sp.]MCL6542086.1 hypothetical protein [Roseiflexus sp.]
MTRRRPRESIDDLIENRVEETVEKKLLEQNEEVPTLSSDPALKKLLANFPSSEGYYGKLYKTLPSGKEELKYTLTVLEEISDPEVEIAGLAKEKGWGSGEYRLRIYKHGTSGLAKSIGMRIDVGNSPSSQQIQTPQVPISEALKQTAETINVLKEMIPKQDVPLKDWSQILHETFKSGVEIAREKTSSQSNNGDVVIKMITIAKELGLFDKKPQISETEIIERVIKNLKEMGILTQPKSEDDILNKLIKLKEIGLVKLAGEDKEDAASLAEKIRPLIDLVNSLGLTGNPPEKLNFWNTIAPHIPSFIEKLIGPLKEFLELRKLELNSRLQYYHQYQRLPNVSGISNVNNISNFAKAASYNNQSSFPQENTIQELVHAVQSGDKSYFPKLVELINLMLGTHVVPALASGQISIDTILNLVFSSQWGKYFKPETSKAYLTDFVLWLRSKSNEKDTEKIVLGKCDICESEFEFPTIESWNSDTKKCECGGTITRVQ